MEKIEILPRLSEAYPPSTSNYGKFLANVHEILKKGEGIVIDPQEIVYTDWTPDFDIAELKLLHKEWFPINYDSKYFDKILDGSKDCILATYPYKTKNKE